MNDSERILSAFSEVYFYKELVLNNLHFTPENSTEKEVADLVINGGDFIIAIQLKARNEQDQTSDSEKEYMGLTSWKNSPNGKILETDVIIAKNYLSKDEIENLELIVSSFLDLAESRAKRNIPMTMEDWKNLLDKYLLLDNRDILKDAGKISHEIACDKALTEFEKYRIKQDKLYKSDFDLLLEEETSLETS